MILYQIKWKRNLFLLFHNPKIVHKIIFSHLPATLTGLELELLPTFIWIKELRLPLSAKRKASAKTIKNKEDEQLKHLRMHNKCDEEFKQVTPVEWLTSCMFVIVAKIYFSTNLSHLSFSCMGQCWYKYVN